MKYPYKTKIAEHGKILITFVDFESAKVAKLDFGKTSVPELARQALMDEIQERINNRQEIPIPKPYPFVAEEVELDWQTVIRIQLSNWFLKDARYSSIKEIDQGHLEQCGIGWALSRASGALTEFNILHLFNLKAELNVTDLVILAYDFGIEIDFKEVKLEFKDKT